MTIWRGKILTEDKRKSINCIHDIESFFFRGYFVLFNGFMHILRHKLSRDIVEKILIYAFPFVQSTYIASRVFILVRDF